MHYVYGYFIVCAVLIICMRHVAERSPVTDVGVDL